MSEAPRMDDAPRLFRREDVPKHLGTWLESVAIEAQKAGAAHIRASDVETALVEAANSPQALAKPSTASRWKAAQAVVHKQLVAVRREAAAAEGGGRFSTGEALPDGRVIEEVLTSEGPQFLVFTPAKLGAREKTEVVSQIVVSGQKVFPLPVTEGLRKAMTLADGVEEYGTVSDLMRDLEQLATEVYDPGKEAPVLRLWLAIMLTTWVYGPFYEQAVERFAPILRITGPSESGKKRLLTVARFGSYRAMYFLKTNRVPSLARTLDPWPGATLILDEADSRDSSESDEFVEFLNSRADGAVLPRYSTESGETQFFASFGTTIVALRKSYSDDGFNSRGVPLKAETTYKDIDLVPPVEWRTRARRIQRQLLLFRLRLLAKARDGKLVLPTKVPLPKVKSHRIRETFLIINAVAQTEGDPKLLEQFADVAEELGKRLVTEKSHTPEGTVLGLVYSALDEGWDVAEESPGFHYLVRSETVEGKTEDQALTAAYLSERTGRAFTSKAITGWWRGLVGEPGTKRFRIRDGSAERGVLIITDVPALQRLFERFVPEAEDQRGRFPARSGPTLDGYAKSEPGVAGPTDSLPEAAQAAQLPPVASDSVTHVPLVTGGLSHPPLDEFGPKNAMREGGSHVGSVTSVTSGTNSPRPPPTAGPRPDSGDPPPAQKTRADRSLEQLDREGGT